MGAAPKLATLLQQLQAVIHAGLLLIDVAVLLLVEGVISGDGVDGVFIFLLLLRQQGKVL